MIPSLYQQAIYDWIEHGTGNALVDAVAGAGKTTTLVEGAKRLTTTNACFVAFNRVIAEEIAHRLQAIDSPMQASTIHSLGSQCLGKVRREAGKYTRLSREYLKRQKIEDAKAVTYLRALVNLAQLTMTEPTEGDLLRLIGHYALDDLLHLVKRDPDLWRVIWRGVRVVIDEGMTEYQRKRLIDFNDMVCLPTWLNLSTPQFDFIFVDECQDLNRAQLELVLACKSPAGRLLFVGDKRQSLYGFAGADTESIETIIARTQARVMPLSICYRCPVQPLRLARQIHPTIEASPTAEHGTVAVITQAEFLKQVQPDEQGGCAVIGRCRAPLVTLCLKLLQQGKKAKVRGRDIGAGIIDIVDALKKAKGFRFSRLLEALSTYRDARVEALASKPENELAIDELLDKVETVIAFYQAYYTKAVEEETPATLDGFEDYINEFFSDEDERQCILFSTIHKAKGLEFNTVYALPEKIPHPLAKNAWQYEQELNAEYVLLTRAKKALYFVGHLIENLIPLTDEPMPPPAAASLALEATVAEIIAEAEAAFGASESEPHEGRSEQHGEKKSGGRPRKHKERLQIKVSREVAVYLRSLKGGDDGYSGYLETLVQCDPQFLAFLEQHEASIPCG